jgi:hypothetical protein
MFGRVIYSDQRLYLNSALVNGVTECSADVNLSQNDIFVAGIGQYDSYIQQPIEGTFNLNRHFFYNVTDVITGYFNSNISGSILYKKTEDSTYKHFSFETGRITSYSLECSVGTIPTNNVSMQIMGGNFGSNFTQPSTPLEQELASSLPIVKPKDITIGIGFFDTDRVQSFNYNISVDYKRNDTIGYLNKALDFEPTYPIVIETSFDIEVDEYEAPNFLEQICLNEEEDISFTYESCEHDYVRNMCAPKSKLTSLNFNAGIGNAMTFSLSYRSILNNITDVGRVLSLGSI